MTTATLEKRTAPTQLLVRLSTSVFGRAQTVSLAGRSAVRVKLAA
ncbi:MAG: hypothetical protein ACYDCQ_21015 [Dehalococcoidia bacterium]